MTKSLFIKILISCIFIVMVSNFLYVQPTYALAGILPEGKDFVAMGAQEQKINTDGLRDTSNTIYNALLAIGIMVAIIIAMILGIQFIVASADEKAKIKEALIPFVVGCFVAFGAFTIWKLAVNIGNRAETSVEDGPKTELLKEKQYLLAVTDEDILKMTRDEVIEFQTKVFDFKRQTTIEITIEEKDRLDDQMDLTSDLINNNSYGGSFNRWFKYKENIGITDDYEALKTMVETNLNDYKKPNKIEDFKNYVFTAKSYFKISYFLNNSFDGEVQYETLEKLLNIVIDNADKRKSDIYLPSLSGRTPPDSEIEDIKQKEEYKSVFRLVC